MRREDRLHVHPAARLHAQGRSIGVGRRCGIEVLERAERGICLASSPLRSPTNIGPSRFGLYTSTTTTVRPATTMSSSESNTTAGVPRAGAWRFEQGILVWIVTASRNQGLGDGRPHPESNRAAVDLTHGKLPTVEETRLTAWASELCPRLCPNRCLPSTNTITSRETPRDIVPERSR